MSYSPPETAVQEELSLQIGVDDLKGQIQPTRRPRISQRFRILRNVAVGVMVLQILGFVYIGVNSTENLASTGSVSYWGWVSFIVILLGFLGIVIYIIGDALRRLQEQKWNARQPKPLPFTLNTHGLQIGNRHWPWRDAPLCSMNLCNNQPSVLILHPKSGDELRLTGSDEAISWLLQLIEGFKQNVDRDATVPKELLQMRATQSKGTQPSRNTGNIQQ